MNNKVSAQLCFLGWSPCSRVVAAFLDFFTSFKSSTTEAEAALEGLQIDDGTSDEYDFMDDIDDNNAQQSRRSEKRRPTKRKYMEMLQDVADRKRDHVIVDLDDLDEVLKP